MIEEKTIVDQLEITRDRSIQVRLAFVILKDGAELGEPRWHRTVIAPGESTDDQLAAVNAHISQMGRESLPAADVSYIKSVAEFVHTPSVVTAYRQAKQARENAEAALQATAGKS